MVGIAEQQIVWYRSFKLRHRKGVLRDTLGMELAFPLLTLTAALGLLHIGEQEDQHDPKPQRVNTLSEATLARVRVPKP